MIVLYPFQNSCLEMPMILPILRVMVGKYTKMLFDTIFIWSASMTFQGIRQAEIFVLYKSITLMC